MQEQLAAIDLAPLEELTGIQKDLDVLQQRLKAMEERKGQVAPAVYQRVASDYAAQRTTLEQRAEPLRATARGEYARLHALRAQCEADCAAIALDREEIEFRFALGEFEEAEHKRRLKAVDAALREKEQARAAADALRERFVAAFGSAEALEQQAPAPVQADTTQRMKALESAAAPSAPPPAPPAAAAAPAAAELGATQVMRTLKGNEAGPVRADQTVIVRTARLVPQNPEAGKQNLALALKPMRMGSDSSCDIRIAGARGEHAEIRVSMAGYTISDLGGGLRVNGVAVEQHLLRHDDVVEIAAARFAFREG